MVFKMMDVMLLLLCANVYVSSSEDEDSDNRVSNDHDILSAVKEVSFSKE